jgi:hypothetical protein
MHMPAHGHTHDHGDRNAWFLDQLCSIAVCGAYAGVIFSMFYVKWMGLAERSLINIIVPWIQYMLLGGAVVLLLLTILRAIGVWQASRNLEAFDPHQGHDHAPGEGHDHSHGWSPWKYIPLVIPLVLYIGLGLPDSRMIMAYERNLTDRALPRGSGLSGAGSLDAVMQAQVLLGEVGACGPGFGLPTAVLSATLVPGGYATEIAEEELNVDPDATPSLGELDQIASNPSFQQTYKNYRRVEVEGNFYPASADGRFFRVVRLRVACCLGDARPAIVMCVSRKPNDIQSGDWVAAQGKLDFVADEEGKWFPVMRVYKVYKRKAPAYPYLK